MVWLKYPSVLDDFSKIWSKKLVRLTIWQREFAHRQSHLWDRFRALRRGISASSTRLKWKPTVLTCSRVAVGCSRGF
jgi:hypothetical protein